MSGQTDFTLFQKKLDYQFRQEKYLSIALTHSSYANEGKIKKVAISTYIITPYNVDILGDLIDELENNGLYF